jgi:hypothetical protein
MYLWAYGHSNLSVTRGKRVSRLTRRPTDLKVLRNLAVIIYWVGQRQRKLPHRLDLGPKLMWCRLQRQEGRNQVWYVSIMYGCMYMYCTCRCGGYSLSHTLSLCLGQEPGTYPTADHRYDVGSQTTSKNKLVEKAGIQGISYHS